MVNDFNKKSINEPFNDLERKIRKHSVNSIVIMLSILLHLYLKIRKKKLNDSKNIIHLLLQFSKILQSFDTMPSALAMAASASAWPSAHHRLQISTQISLYSSLLSLLIWFLVWGSSPFQEDSLCYGN